MNITDTDPCPSVKKPKGIEIKDIQNIDRPPAVQSVDNHTPLSEPPYPEPEDSFAGLPRFIKKAVLSTNDPAVIQANDVLHTVLQCLSDISTNYFYGAGILSAVLRGVASKRIKERGLDKVNTFGNLSEMSPELIDAIINWAILHKYILRTKSLYPVLHPTYEGTHYEETISARKLQNFPSI